MQSKVFEALEARGLVPRGDRWDAVCPAHDDKRKSLVVGTGDNGATLLTCHAGCTLEDITSALGMEVKDLWPPSEKSEWKPRTQGRVVATYDYTDERGNLLYQVQRMDPKDFRQRKPDNGLWNYKLGNVRRVVYNLHDLCVFRNEPCFIVEGEKDVATLSTLGFLATTVSGGAGGWTKNAREYAEQIGPREVVILPDNDAPGLQFANDVLQTIPHAIVVRLPVPEKGDVTDWVNAGGDDCGLKLRVILVARAAVESAKKRLDNLANLL